MGTAARDLMEQAEEEEEEEEGEGEEEDDSEERQPRATRNGGGGESPQRRCRICARSLPALDAAASIFGEDGGLQKLIQKYLGIAVSIEDRLPKMVCTTCMGKLDGIHAFATMALRSQEKLRQELLRTSVDSAVTVDSSDSSDSTSNKPGDRSLLHSILTKGSSETPNEGEITQVRQRTPSTEEMEVKVDPMLFLQCAFDRGSSAENSDFSEDYSDQEMSSYESPISEPLPLINRIRNKIKNKGKEQAIKNDRKEDDGKCNETKDEDELEDGQDIGDKLHNCKICARAFGTQIALQNHLWSHLPTTTSGSVMKNQDRVDNGATATNGGLPMDNNGCGEQNLLVGNFICPICGKNISTKGNLKVHLETHRPKGKYGCDICGRIFKTQSNLFRHKEYHSGVQFPCGVCGRVYPTNSTLRAHSITHSDLRPHACLLCDRTFKRNQDLKFHINYHTGARPYQCPYCSKAFASSGNCFSHRKRMHPKEVNRDRQRAADLMR